MAASILYDVIVFAPVKFWYGFFLGVGPFSQGRDSGVEQRRGNVTHAEYSVKHLKGHKMLVLIMQGFEGFGRFLIRMLNFQPIQLGECINLFLCELPSLVSERR